MIVTGEGWCAVSCNRCGVKPISATEITESHEAVNLLKELGWSHKRHSWKDIFENFCPDCLSVLNNPKSRCTECTSILVGCPFRRDYNDARYCDKKMKTSIETGRK